MRLNAPISVNTCDLQARFTTVRQKNHLCMFDKKSNLYSVGFVCGSVFFERKREFQVSCLDRFNRELNFKKISPFLSCVYASAVQLTVRDFLGILSSVPNFRFQ